MLQVAAGKDYITPRPNGRWLTLHWVMEIVPRNGKPFIPHRGDYGSDDLYARQPMISHSGEFSQGLGAVPDVQRPAVLWCYNHFVEPGRREVYDAIMYPHQAVCAFVNWPAGREPRNPAETMPRAVEDRIYGYYLFRNRWQDENDILVTTLMDSGPAGYKKVGDTAVHVWGLGKQMRFGNLRNCKPGYFYAAQDGSGIVASQRGSSLAVDFSGASGAPALVIMVGPIAGGTRKVEVGGRTFHLTALGADPEPKVDGDAVVVGDQTIRYDGHKLALSRIAPPWKGP